MPAPGDGLPRTVDPRVVRTRNDVLRATLDLLIDEGLESVTHQRVALAAGYARATIYAHWPARADLLREALTRFVDVPHHTPTGDLRTDLVQELISFRTAMRDHRLDRVLAVLVDLTASVPEMVEIRDRLVSNGERTMRALLEPVLHGAELEAATLTLCGAVLHGALMHGRPPEDDVIESAVDLMLCGLRWRQTVT